MAFFSLGTQQVDDLVLISNPSNASITSALGSRYSKDLIYTNIGEVLISVNPYRNLNNATDEYVKLYQSSTGEAPPHIYGLAELTYRALVNENSSQAVIISGESGAGKTEAAKLILNYVSASSGKSTQHVQYIKSVILQSNPLLEAFGNAKTVRNDNSSRFGKYLEIQFSPDGEPQGGVTTNFLLEKTRVAFQARGERNFHIFYQLVEGAPAQWKTDMRLGAPSTFHYLSQSGVTTVEGVSDAQGFSEVQNAMNVIKISPEEQQDIMYLLSGILWLGNIRFVDGNPAKVQNSDALDTAAMLLGVEQMTLTQALVFRMIQTGSAKASVYNVPQNAQQAAGIRDSLAATLYSRLFDLVIKHVNTAMKKPQDSKLVLGILDIYGFEIFEKNGFEQFCINYVNERLQQIFIDLTLRAEQKEYVDEGMRWKDIEYFDNKVVCELIDGLKPPGIFRLLDDTCRTVHSTDSATADMKFLEKLMKQITNNHLQVPQTDSRGRVFVVKHYAGDVNYCIDDFTSKNNDNLYPSLGMCMQTSVYPFVTRMFPEKFSDDKRAPSTAGFKIRKSAQELVKSLTECTPHYVRCIKPNDNKRAGDFNTDRCHHQVKYLGLLENVKVKRAGYAYRHFFDVFLRRFSALSDTPLPPGKEGCRQLLTSPAVAKSVQASDWELGKTKIFVKNPETIFMMDEMVFMKTDPQGYKEKVQQFKEQEKKTAQARKQNLGSLKPKCLIQ